MKAYLHLEVTPELPARVMAIGLRRCQMATVIWNEAGTNERGILAQFWRIVAAHLAEGGTLVGFNAGHCEIPFMVRRSWALGVAVPPGILTEQHVPNPERICGLLDVWQCGDRAASISLDGLARYLGEPPGPPFPLHFAALADNAETRGQAEAAVFQRLELLESCAKRMGAANPLDGTAGTEWLDAPTEPGKWDMLTAGMTAPVQVVEDGGELRIVSGDMLFPLNPGAKWRKVQ